MLICKLILEEFKSLNSLGSYSGDWYISLSKPSALLCKFLVFFMHISSYSLVILFFVDTVNKTLIIVFLLAIDF